MKAHFTFTPVEGHTTRGMAKELIMKTEFRSYMFENLNTELIVTIQPKVKSQEKLRMYAYYRGPLLDVAMMGLVNAGYEGMDKAKAHYFLSSYCAKEMMIRKGEEFPYILSVGDMSKKRLHKYIVDCIHFMEANLDIRSIPDAEEYKNAEKFGEGFKKVENE